MAHNINTYVGRQPAWFKLGLVTGEYQTLDQIMSVPGMNFQVSKRQLEYAGKPVDAWGIFRDDNGVFLGSVGSDYQVIQHVEGFRMTDSLLDAANHGSHYETAGVLGKGERVWGLADLRISMSVGSDRSEVYLLFSTAHDGSMSHNYRLTSTRVVCQNTLNIALSSKTSAKLAIRHTKNAMDRINRAHEALAEVKATAQSVEEKLNFLATRKVTRESLTSVMDKLFPVAKGEDGKPKESTRRENIIADILSRFESNDGNAYPEQRGTAYNLLNGITEYTDHYRTGTRGGAVAESAMFGSGDRLKTQALEVITLAANGMPQKQNQVQVFAPIPATVSLLDQIVQDHGRVS